MGRTKYMEGVLIVALLLQVFCSELSSATSLRRNVSRKHLNGASIKREAHSRKRYQQQDLSPNNSLRGHSTLLSLDSDVEFGSDEGYLFWDRTLELSMSMLPEGPSATPTENPTITPTAAPTSTPETNPPSEQQSNNPSNPPSQTPSLRPSDPSNSPTNLASFTPTSATANPTAPPSASPSTLSPSMPPTVITTEPTNRPSSAPSEGSGSPTSVFSTLPTSSSAPTELPSSSPSTSSPSAAPSVSPSTSSPSAAPSVLTNAPSTLPSSSPTDSSDIPTRSPTTENQSSQPTTTRSNTPSITSFSLEPSESPSRSPSSIPTSPPSISNAPSMMPSGTPSISGVPSQTPTTAPSQSPTSFQAILSLQNEVGVCSGSTAGIGCADEGDSGAMGNPNDLVNCYDVTEFGGSVPFSLSAVRFWIGNSIPLPPDLSLRVWEGAPGTGPTSNTPLFSQSVGSFNFGENLVQLGVPLELMITTFCVGLFSENVMSALRIQTEMGAGDNSFVLAPACGANVFTPLEGFGVSQDFCIEAFIFG